MFTDISQHKQAQAHLDYLANHDALTRLVNRTSFHASAQEALLRAQRNNQIFALLFIGLDNFKAINDTLGHPVGASLLQGIAQRLSESVRETDVVARLGGDEFTVLLESLTDGQGVATLTQKIINALEQPLNLADQTLFISASIGISIFPGDGHNAAHQRLAHGVSKWRIFSELSTAPGLTLGTSGWGGSLTALASPRFWARIARDIHPLSRQSFVHDIPHDLDDMAIARAVIALATSLKLKVVGEGVETEAQRVFLEAEGCHEVQGFFYCKPLPAEEVAAYIRQHTLQAQATD